MRRALFAAGMVALMTVSTAAQGSTERLRWILNGPALQYFTTNASARAFFAGARPFVMMKKDAETALPASWEAQEVRSFSNVAGLERGIETGLAPSVKAVLYDNEHWQFTPAAEQADPAGSTQRAAEAAHRHGLLLIATPAVNLVRALDPQGSGKTYDRFLQLGVIRDAARFADIVVIQAQGSETALPLYSSFVRAAAAQAREANPHAIVLAGISTNPSGQRVSAEQILAAIHATRSAVEGYWFNVPAPGPYCPACNDFRPDLAIQVLSALGPGA
jgi:hypothetical protein